MNCNTTHYRANSSSVPGDPTYFASCCRGGVYDPDCDWVAAGVPEPEFLRPGASLAVVFLSDEEDCSDPASDPRSGCAGETCAISRDDNDNCALQADRLTPVRAYYDFLFSLKQRPTDQLAVAAIVGPRPPTESPAASVEPTCESRHGVAYSGSRYLELAEMFDPQGFRMCLTCGDICAEDYGPALRLVTSYYKLSRTLCLSTPPRDPAAVVLRISCETLREEGGHCLERLAPRALGPDEYVLDPDPDCPGGYKVVLFEPDAYGGKLEILYEPVAGARCPEE